MPKVLVTGAAGFLGATLVNELCKAGVEVRAVVREPSRYQSFSPGVETRVADIRHSLQTEEIASGCEAIVHLAAKVPGIDDSRLEKSTKPSMWRVQGISWMLP